MSENKTFLMIHGGWAGGWIWGDVASILASEGHTAICPSLLGMSERQGELGPHVDLSAHIMDVERIILENELKDLILVGNSYGGLVISGVADRLPEETVSGLIYLDALYLDDGERFDPPPEFEAALEKAEVSGAQCFLPPPSSMFGLQGEKAERADRSFTPFPIACLTEEPRIAGVRDRVVNKTFVVAEKSALPDFKAIGEKLSTTHGWKVERIDTDHLPMMEAPELTAQLLLETLV